MVMASYKKICINNETFSYGEFAANPSVYLPKISHLFRASTLNKKSGETDSEYYSRIFGLAYYSKHLAVTSSNSNQAQTQSSTPANVAVSEKEIADTAVLTKLGISPIRKTAVFSNIIFKNSGNEYTIKNTELEKLINMANSKIKYDRAPTDIKFGIEFEFIGLDSPSSREAFSDAMRKLVGKSNYSSNLSYQHNDGSKWILGVDGSLRTRESNYRGYELTTPIFTLCQKDLDCLKQVLDLVYLHLDGHPNKSCGTHVHISFDSPSTVTRELCFKFAKAYKNSESSLFDKLVPVHRRENNCTYCQSANTTDFQRFTKLNLQNAVMNSSRLHLEFRQLNGTLDFDRVIAWVKLQKMFIEITINAINKESNSFIPINLEYAVCNDSFNAADVESFLVMSKVAV